MAEIKPLKTLDIDHFHQLSIGYTSMEKFIVTKSETDDQTTISLHRQTLDQPYNKRWEDDLDLEAHYAEVIQQGLSLGLYCSKNLIGIAISEKRAWNRTLWVWEFHIDPAYQGQGYGRKLMGRLTEIGKQAECRVIVCETQNTNAPAIHFYRSVGFEIGAVDLSYYTNKDPEEFEVAIFMKRYLE